MTNEGLNMMKSIIAAMVLLICPQWMKAGEIYVAEGQSIADAIKQAREWRRLAKKGLAEYQAKIEDGITIRIAAGRHNLTKPLFIRPEDTGNVQSPTRIAGEDGAIISGGVAVGEWTRHEGNIYVAQTPRVNGRMVETRQLWCDGRKAHLAQLSPLGTLDTITGLDKDKRQITIDAKSIEGLNLKGDRLEMFLCQRWAVAILRVKDIKNGVMTFHEPESELEFSHPWPQPVVEGDNRSAYTLRNAYSFLNEQDEWYQDGDKIYYYSETGAPRNVVIPYLTSLLNIEGSEETPVENLTIENICFEHTAWLRPSLEGLVTLQGGFRLLDAYKLPIEGLYHKAGLENQAWIARAEMAVGVKNCRNIAFDRCTFQHFGATALDLVDNVSASGITNCHFQDIGGTALQLGTFPDGPFETHIPYIPANPQRLCNNILIKGNTIHDATNEDWGCVGISAGYVSDVVIEENHVYDLNYSGIFVGWGWTKLDSSMKRNIIRNNKVHDFALQLYDAGGIYTLSNQPESQIVDNEIYNIGQAPYATNNRAFYIYFDEATDGFLVKGNKIHDKNKAPNEKFGYNQQGPKLIIQ